MKKTNQLHLALSPYLQQHASNPVSWQFWNNENLEHAKKQNKLLIISIGYAACHWCHVMEKECFEDEEVATVMNDFFFSFKIDREEMPAVDAFYMQALQLMTKQGGWPLNIVALPNGLPVWGATYVPKEQWIDVLQQLNELFIEDPEKMFDYAEKLQNGMALANDMLQIYPKEMNTFDIESLLKNWTKSFDWDYGGYSRAPKFMMPTNLNFLFDYGVLHNDSSLLNYIELTLTKMAYGGLFDVVEGGFSRYSVDHKWHIPHFEKMLYDNAQLLSVYTNVYLHTKNPLFKEVVQKTTAFILNNWKDTSGGFYAAFDADSENQKGNLQEGAYYFWKKNILISLIPTKEWDLFCEVFSINSEGYWEEAEAFVLFQKHDLKFIAEYNKITLQELIQLKLKWEHILFGDRQKRKKPLLDDKIIISWNAQLLSGLLDASKIIDAPYLNDAVDVLADFLQFKAYNNQLGRVFKEGKSYIKGTLEDHAFTIEAFINLFNHSQKIDHLQFAKDLAFEAFDLFYDEVQGFFKSTDNELVGTVFETEDNVIPSANAIMARVVFYLGFLYENEYFTRISNEMTERILGQIDYASAYSEWLRNNLMIKNNFEYVIVANPTKQELDQLNKKNTFRLIIDNSLNIPILDSYKNQNKKFQVCNLISCTLQTDHINKILTL